jgi:hypothetical protein
MQRLHKGGQFLHVPVNPTIGVRDLWRATEIMKIHVLSGKGNKREANSPHEPYKRTDHLQRQ